MAKKVNRIYMISDAITTLNMEEAKTSSHKYELSLARALSQYAKVTVFCMVLPVGKKSESEQLELVGIKSSEGSIYEDIVSAFELRSNENAVILFWGYDIKKVCAILHIKYKLHFKCIAFEYDTHTVFVNELKQPRRTVIDMYCRLGRRAMTLCDAFIFFQEKAVQRLHVKRKKYLICKPGYEEKKIVRNADKTKAVVVYCGSFTQLNGIDALIDSFELIQDDHIEVVICGDGPMKNAVIEAAQKYAFVHYMGLLNQAELEKVYEKASVLLNLRRLDDEAMDFAFPSKVFEYISMKIPMISTRVLNDSDFVDNIHLIERIDAVHVANAIKAVCQNSSQSEEKAGKLSEYIKNTYSTKEMTMKIYSFINTVVSDGY